MPARWPPDADLVPDVASALPFLNRAIERSHDAALNVEGGDVGGVGSAQLVARHVANYQVATEAARALGAPPGAILDVGCGVGALSAWAAEVLDRALVLCDQDVDVVTFGGETFSVPAQTDLAETPPAAVVLAMEVLEHVPPDAQRPFVDLLWQHVEPGGLLVVSTPDETRYPGGWSGYAPHVGCVSPEQLHDLLASATGADVRVHRLDGGPFDLSWPRRVLERVANSTWTAVQSWLPGPADTLARRGRRQEALSLEQLERARTPFRLVPPATGSGTGLFAVVQRSEAETA